MQLVATLFDDQLVERVMSLAISIWEASDVRVRRSSCISRAATNELYEIYRDEPTRTMDGAWIWRL